MSAGFQVRRPCSADWPQIMTLLESANFDHIGGSEMPEFPVSDCFAAFMDKTVIGVCGYRMLGNQQAKNTLTVVLPEYREKGVATAIKAHCVEYLEGQGVTTLFTNCDHELAIEWNIRNFGFRRTGKLIPKVESFGLKDVGHWVNLVADLPNPDNAITQQEVDQYQDRGFLHLSGRFDENDAREWADEVSRLWALPGLLDKESFRVQGRERIDGGYELERVDWVLPESECFMVLALDKRILTPVEQLLKDKPVIFKDKVLMRPPGTMGYGLHQDFPYWESAGLPPGAIITVCVAIDSTNANNGALGVFSGHHHNRLKPPENNPMDADLNEVDLDSEEQVCMEAGDLFLFHTLAPHRSSPNKSSGCRKVIYLSYAAASYGESVYDRYYQQKAGKTA